MFAQRQLASDWLKECVRDTYATTPPSPSQRPDDRGMTVKGGKQCTNTHGHGMSGMSVCVCLGLVRTNHRYDTVGGTGVYTST